ncbi:imidazole glycerol phosphate synthase, glutamine amidotransferase subunit [Limosilactobacillus fermentum]|nr:hypothetical protein [Limosilactobacillus fermentum]BAW86488.1 imidazole glycerol phosphate synthase, glutamine amidotransferase subunit [Limosilactobacillus fermentum]
MTNDAKQVVSSDGIILTGIGTYQSGMTNLMQLHLIRPIRRAVEQGVPLLGIGLGMELLFDYSTEGGLISGLGLIKGRGTEIPSTLATAGADCRLEHEPAGKPGQLL